MIEFFKVKEDTNKNDSYLKSGNVHVIANKIPVGLVQELVITERKDFQFVQIDISRILDPSNELEKILGINTSEKLTLEVIENRGDYEIHFEFKDCEVDRISGSYNAERYSTVEYCTIVSSVYYKNKKAK